MNAPLQPTIETIDIYSEILTQGFIEETKKRALLIQEDKEKALQASSCMEDDFVKIQKGLASIKKEIAVNTALFDRITEMSRKNAAMMFEASRILRASADKIARTAEQRKKRNTVILSTSK